MPLFERVRVEVYLPDPHKIEYDQLLRTLEREFTFAFGGCTVVRGLEGNYLARLGDREPDQIVLVYTDISLALSKDFAAVDRYAAELKRIATEALTEEVVMIAVKQVYHAV